MSTASASPMAANAGAAGCAPGAARPSASAAQPSKSPLAKIIQGTSGARQAGMPRARCRIFAWQPRNTAAETLASANGSGPGASSDASTDGKNTSAA
ncbi:MAG: hypothetical protein M5U30_13340 [Burkholderiaceae bacterium]|nr:hypothetical protein [Burkholderiaceae bacterium]